MHGLGQLVHFTAVTEVRRKLDGVAASVAVDAADW